MNQDTISEETGIYSSETEYFSPFVPPMFASKIVILKRWNQLAVPAPPA
jgi:hypothetical protein